MTICHRSISTGSYLAVPRTSFKASAFLFVNRNTALFFTEYFELFQEQKLYDQKNIRRRVYDAINVLMALGIIVKDKKDLCWVGLPGPTSQQCGKLKVDFWLLFDRQFENSDSNFFVFQNFFSHKSEKNSGVQKKIQNFFLFFIG